MVARPSRESKYNTEEDRRAAEEVAENPPVIIWETVPGSGGIRVGRLVEDPATKPQPRPPCSCENLHGDAKRRHGRHHAEDCGRRRASR